MNERPPYPGAHSSSPSAGKTQAFVPLPFSYGTSANVRKLGPGAPQSSTSDGNPASPERPSEDAHQAAVGAAQPTQNSANPPASGSSDGSASAESSVESKAPAAAKTPAPRPVMSPADREFLPAALEILETPAAPKSIFFMLTICSFVTLALIWSYFGHLDVHAVAWGKIEADGRAKIVQPLESGKVISIHAVNGAEVRAGDLLVELDPAEAKADAVSARESLNAFRAEVARRQAAIESARKIEAKASLSPPAGKQIPTSKQEIAFDSPKIAFGDDIPRDVRQRETAVIIADLTQLQDTLRNLDKQIAQREAAKMRLDMSIAQQVDLIRTLEERVYMRESSIKAEVGTKIGLYDAKEALLKSQSQLASDRGQLLETAAGIEELKSQKTKSISAFIADNETRLADADRKGAEAAQTLAKARTKLARTIMESPINGVVQQMAVTTIGQVVTTGQQLMLISPKSGVLRADVFVSNADIGFIRVGQRAEVKIDSFPFTRFGVIEAKVESIASEAIDEQDAKRLQANPIASANAAGSNSNTAPGQQQNFVFPVTLKLESTSIRVGEVDAPLIAGMTVTAEIKTDKRRVIDYLLSPLSKIGSEAMRER